LTLISDITVTVAGAVWLMLPAYLANPLAAVTGGGTPLDLGRNLWDGRRILGDGKTIRGLTLGTMGGTLVGITQGFPPSVSLTLSLGALLGDIAKSFLKRRLGYPRGAKMPLADQLDFVAGAWTATYLLNREWFTGHFTPPILLAVILITPLLHRLTNIIGYKIKVKKEPW